jgi:hypothetical protein
MFPITSLTTSLGHNGLIDIFALSNSRGAGATVRYDPADPRRAMVRLVGLTTPGSRTSREVTSTY